MSTIKLIPKALHGMPAWFKPPIQEVDNTGGLGQGLVNKLQMKLKATIDLAYELEYQNYIKVDGNISREKYFNEVRPMLLRIAKELPQIGPNPRPAPVTLKEKDAYERGRLYRVLRAKELEEAQKANEVTGKVADAVVLTLPYLVPGVGQALMIDNIGNDLYEGNNFSALFNLGLLAAPFAPKGLRALKYSKPMRPYTLSYKLNKGIKNTKLETPVLTSKNPANSRYKLGDAEMDDPNLMYHVDNGDFTGFSGNGAYVKDGLLFPTQNESGQTPYTWWNLGRPYRNGQTRLLTTTKDNPSLLRVREQNYPIGQWNGSRGFVTNLEYVSSEPVKIGNQYIYEPDYGYRRVSNNIPTLNLQDVLNTKISLNHVLPELYVIPNFTSKHGSLAMPSTADTPVGWGNSPVLFLKNSAISKYPHHQAYIGDGLTNTVTGVFGRNKDLTNYSLSELQEALASKIAKVKEPYLPEKSHPVVDEDMIFNSKLRRYLSDRNPDAYIGPSYDELHFHSAIPLEDFKYAFLPDYETASELLPLFDKYGIKTNFDFSDKRGVDLEAFRKWITDNDKDIGFRKGGKLIRK